MENEDNKNVGSKPQAPRPASLLTNSSANGKYRLQSMEKEQQKMVATESPNVEEKVLAQIRAKSE